MWDSRRGRGSRLGHLGHEPGGGLDRRTLLRGGLALLAFPALARARGQEPAPEPDPEADGPPASLVQALESSPYVYVSPLKSDGSESRCHGEVWYAWLDGSVVLITASDTWKTRALERGLDRARIWVGDYGRWNRPIGTNDAFRQGPSFLARGEAFRDGAVLDRLLAAYDEKYPREIGGWRDRMRRGHEEGSRTLIRYGYVPG